MELFRHENAFLPPLTTPLTGEEEKMGPAAGLGSEQREEGCLIMEMYTVNVLSLMSSICLYAIIDVLLMHN